METDLNRAAEEFCAQDYPVILSTSKTRFGVSSRKSSIEVRHLSWSALSRST